MSQGYPYFVAQVLKDETSCQAYMTHMQSIYGDRIEEVSPSNVVGNTSMTTTKATRTTVDIARVLTGVLWRKRAGVIANSFK